MARFGAVAEATRKRNPTQRDADRRLMSARLSGAERADFEQHGWMSALCHGAICAFWAELVPDAFAEAPEGAG